jgi:hypothetical protein
MKKLFFVLTIAAFLFSCGNKKKEQSQSTHNHADGTVHTEESHNETKPDQESFNVSTDGHNKDEAHGESHDKNHEHSHDSNDEHKH